MIIGYYSITRENEKYTNKHADLQRNKTSVITVQEEEKRRKEKFQMMEFCSN